MMMACNSANAGIKAIKSHGFEDKVREKLLLMMEKSCYTELQGQINILKNLSL